jgi:hypothetical protein
MFTGLFLLGTIFIKDIDNEWYIPLFVCIDYWIAERYGNKD